MKKSNLKLLIANIIRESIIDKIGEGQPVGGVKNDHDFDTGRQSVMKAVNVAENDIPKMNTLEVYRQTGVKCGEAQRKKDQGTVSHLMDWFHKAVRMEEEMSKKLAIDAFNKGYREGTGYSQQQKPQYFREKVGFDGKYVDDMESGVAVKKLHSLDESADVVDYNSACLYLLTHGFKKEELPSKEDAENYIRRFKSSWWGWVESWMNSKFEPHSVNENLNLKQRFVYPEDFKSVKNYIRVAKWPATDEFVVLWYENGRLNEDKSYFTDDALDARNTFILMKMDVDKANNPGMNNGVNEMTGTGAVAGYSTPFAFSKKGGSKRALDVTTKMGYKKVKDID
jgi:hypothetical protein